MRRTRMFAIRRSVSESPLSASSPPVTTDVVGQVCRGAEGRGDGLVLSLGDGGDGLELVGGEVVDEGLDLLAGVVGERDQGGQARWAHLGKGSDSVFGLIDSTRKSIESHWVTPVG